MLFAAYTQWTEDEDTQPTLERSEAFDFCERFYYTPRNDSGAYHWAACKVVLDGDFRKYAHGSRFLVRFWEDDRQVWQGTVEIVYDAVAREISP